MDRSPSRLALLLIPLLLACFAIPAMGARDETPNHKEVLLNFIPPNMSVPCAGEQVDIRGQFKLKFGFEKFGPVGEPQFFPVDRDVAKGIGQVPCPASGECNVGRGLTPGIGRLYTANTRIGIRKVETHETSGKGGGECILWLKITSVPNRPPQGDMAPGRQFSYKIFYNVNYGFDKNKNGKREVTFFKATPTHCGEKTN